MSQLMSPGFLDFSNVFSIAKVSASPVKPVYGLFDLFEVRGTACYDVLSFF